MEHFLCLTLEQLVAAVAFITAKITLLARLLWVERGARIADKEARAVEEHQRAENDRKRLEHLQDILTSRGVNAG